MAYDALPRFYDALTHDVDYEDVVRYIERRFRDADIPVRSVLDLACGTGTVAHSLAARGYDVVATDMSEEMLAVAAGKSGKGPAPLFLHQRMEALDLYGTVDAAVCLLDGVNHLTDEAALRETFRRVALFLNPGGVFVFDVHAPAYLASLDGMTFSDETEEALCVWRIAASAPETYAYLLDVFSRRGALWDRASEEHAERAYAPEVLERVLRDVGFADVRFFDGRGDRPADERTERIYVSAVKRRLL